MTGPCIDDAAKLRAAGAAKNVLLTYRTRPLAHLSFRLNYALGGMDVEGYHVFNLFVHLLNALVLYALVALTMRTPYLAGLEGGGHIAFFSALLFALHPVQTQAVTYISQRFTSLVALFYLGSLFFYAKWRLGRGPDFKFQHSTFKFYVLSLLFAVLAMKTKENALTLPAAIALYEFMFFTGAPRRRLLYLLPMALAALIIPISALGAGDLDAVTRAQTAMSRHVYLFTQFRVIATYLRLLFLPINQNLDYDYPVYTSFLSPVVFLSFLLLLVLFGLGVYLLRLSRQGGAGGPRLAAFGIFWFFLTLSVESSIIPMIDVIFEHRLYLPSAGALTAIVTGAYAVMKRLRLPSVLLALLVAALLTYASYARNKVWQSELALWQDVVKKSPDKARGHNNLGNTLADAGRLDEALKHYEIASAINPRQKEAHNNIGEISLRLGLTDAAIERFRRAIELNPDYADAHANLGNAYLLSGQADMAIAHLRTAIKLKPGHWKAHHSLSLAYLKKGMTGKSREHFSIAERLKAKTADKP